MFIGPMAVVIYAHRSWMGVGGGLWCRGILHAGNMASVRRALAMAESGWGGCRRGGVEATPV